MVLTPLYRRAEHLKLPLFINLTRYLYVSTDMYVYVYFSMLSVTS